MRHRQQEPPGVGGISQNGCAPRHNGADQKNPTTILPTQLPSSSAIRLRYAANKDRIAPMEHNTVSMAFMGHDLPEPG